MTDVLADLADLSSDSDEDYKGKHYTVEEILATEEEDDLWIIRDDVAIRSDFSAHVPLDDSPTPFSPPPLEPRQIIPPKEKEEKEKVQQEEEDDEEEENELANLLMQLSGVQANIGELVNYVSTLIHGVWNFLKGPESITQPYLAPLRPYQMRPSHSPPLTSCSFSRLPHHQKLSLPWFSDSPWWIECPPAHKCVGTLRAIQRRTARLVSSWGTGDPGGLAETLWWAILAEVVKVFCDLPGSLTWLASFAFSSFLHDIVGIILLEAIPLSPQVTVRRLCSMSPSPPFGLIRPCLIELFHLMDSEQDVHDKALCLSTAFSLQLFNKFCKATKGCIPKEKRIILPAL